jgi:cytochrome c-type biogenesis protein CcmF
MLPVAFVLLLAMGIGPVTPYRLARASVVWRRISTPVVIGLVAGAVAVLVGVQSIPVVLLVVLGVFVIATVGGEFMRQLGKVEGRGLQAINRLLRRDPGYWGGQISHIGVAVLAIAIAASSGMAVREQVRLATGDRVTVDGYCLVYLTPSSYTEPNRQVTGAILSLRDASCENEIGTLEPVFNTYARPPSVATPSVHTGFTEDVFVALRVPGDEIVIDVMVFPLMWLLWAGGLIAVGGGLWAVYARKPRRRREVEKVTVDA